MHQDSEMVQNKEIEIDNIHAAHDDNLAELFSHSLFIFFPCQFQSPQRLSHDFDKLSSQATCTLSISIPLFCTMSES